MQAFLFNVKPRSGKTGPGNLLEKPRVMAAGVVMGFDFLLANHLNFNNICFISFGHFQKIESGRIPCQIELMTCRGFRVGNPFPFTTYCVEFQGGFILIKHVQSGEGKSAGRWIRENLQPGIILRSIDRKRISGGRHCGGH